MKKLFFIVAGILVLSFVILALAGGSVVRAGVEKGTAYCLDVPVKVEGGSLNLLTGRVGLSGMEISNPPGFQGKHCFKLGSAGVSTQLTSLFSDTVVVESVNLEAAELAIELGPGGTNLGALKARMDQKLGKGAEPKEGAAGKKYLVKILSVKSCKLDVAQPLGGAKLSPVTLPDIVVRDIGYDASNSGATLTQILTRLLDELAIAAGRASAGFPAQVADALAKEGSAAAKELEAAVKTGNVESMKKALEKTADDATKALDDLLKKKK